MGKFKAVATSLASALILVLVGCASPNIASFGPPPSQPPTSPSGSNPGGGGTGNTGGSGGANPTVTISPSPTSLNFSSVNVGSSTSQPVTLTNTGTAIATISGVVITGASSSYSVSGVANGTAIAPGATVTASVTFTPQSAAALTASISIASNATNSPAAIAVSGTGVTPPPPPPPGDITAINHIIFLSMENRSFDSIFGKLNDYRAKFGLGPDVNGLSPDCSSTNSDWTIPCSAFNKAPDASGFPTTPIYAFHLKTACIQNTSADWIVSHWAYNSQQPSSDTWVGDGFVIGAASASGGQGDTQGIRAMGFYTADDLEFHYWLATQFATSDSWFSPAPTKTEPNRYYMVGATSGGHAYQITKDQTGTLIEPPIQSKTIFDLLNAAGIDWRMYVQQNSPSGKAFAGFAATSAGHIVNDDASASHFIADAQSGNLPPVTYIENPDADEHPGDKFNIESGVALSKAMVDAVMHGPMWQDSVFILTFDEGGGLFDHVQPLAVPNPDGIKPIDICTSPGAPGCSFAALTHANPPAGPADPDGDFTRTGYRVPLMVVSPWVKPGYVSHVQTDYTAWLKFVETRFNLPHLTLRDAAASDMTDFFDFSTPHLLTPPGNEPRVKSLACPSPPTLP